MFWVTVNQWLPAFLYCTALMFCHYLYQVTVGKKLKRKTNISIQQQNLIGVARVHKPIIQNILPGKRKYTL